MLDDFTKGQCELCRTITDRKIFSEKRNMQNQVDGLYDKHYY